MTNKVFLGGTYAETKWREELIPMLKIKYFNPIVKDWTPDAQKNEDKEKKICNIHYYYITSEMKGVFSIAEAMDSAFQKNKICIFQVNPKGFDKSQLKSLYAVIKLIKKYKGIAFINPSLKVASTIINKI